MDRSSVYLLPEHWHLNRYLLADEPTGALDSRSADQLLDLFEQINREGQTILMVTHSAKAAQPRQPGPFH